MWQFTDAGSFVCSTISIGFSSTQRGALGQNLVNHILCCRVSQLLVGAGSRPLLSASPAFLTGQTCFSSVISAVSMPETWTDSLPEHSSDVAPSQRFCCVCRVNLTTDAETAWSSASPERRLGFIQPSCRSWVPPQTLTSSLIRFICVMS